ncbi:MAG: hypothetical protein PHE67_05255 [Campylobacterales bacterium]|nr:hypothetical protein [Campylobacterales bacterium]
MRLETLYKAMNDALFEGNDEEAAKIYCEIEYLESQTLTDAA